MTTPHPGAREVAAGFTDALRPALAADAPALARLAARDVAQLMGLAGLDAALAELARHPGPHRPVEIDHVADRIARLAAVSERAGDVAAFIAADRELGALAAQLASTEWAPSAPAGAPAVATLAVSEALADLPVTGPADAARVRLSLTVASAVRAAIDWLGADVSPRVAIDLHDSALTLTVTVGHEGGIGPAGAVLAAVEGSLGRESDGRWTIRVAVHVERPSYLLLRQGRYGVALPWHSVARLRMFAPHELDRLEEPRLAPLSARAPLGVEQPAALVALGLTRAWFVADRIVWRIAARPLEADSAGPFAGATHEVVVETGDRYWLLDPAWLLRGIAPPEVAPPSPRPRVSATTLEQLEQAPHAAPAPHRDPEPELESGESLAGAVERALEWLRRERGTTAAPAPSAPPAAPLAIAPREPLTASTEMISAAIDVLLPDLAPAEPAPAPIAPAPAAPEPEAIREPEALPEPEVVAIETAPVESVPAAVVPAPPAPAVSIAPTVLPEPPPATLAPPAPDVATSAAPEVALAAAADTPVPRLQVRRALVADDSMVARIFLSRLLEKRGYLVVLVEDAATLWEELPRGPWALVCADIALPDAQGASHVGRVLHFLAGLEPQPPCIVLTRDKDDERTARDAGASAVLRKPFEPARLETLLSR